MKNQLFTIKMLCLFAVLLVSAKVHETSSINAMERPYVEPITFIEPKPIKQIEVINELEPFLTSIGEW